MDTQTKAVRKISPVVDAELERLATLVELRQAVRARREALTAYTQMAKTRTIYLQAALSDAEARVVDFMGVQS